MEPPLKIPPYSSVSLHYLVKYLARFWPIMADGPAFFRAVLCKSEAEVSKAIAQRWPHVVYMSCQSVTRAPC